MIRCGFMPALFSGIGTGPKGSSPEREQHSDWAGMGMDAISCGLGSMRPISETSEWKSAGSYSGVSIISRVAWDGFRMAAL